MIRRILIPGLLTVLLAACSAPEPGVTVTIGPTPIPRGDATSANDITVNNGLFAVSFAVDTASPWGVARGGMLDVGIIRDGAIDYDFVSLIDFMPNRWSAWPTTYQSVEVETQEPDRVVIRTRRDWGPVELDTRFEFLAGDSTIHVVTTMTNTSDQDMPELLSGYIAWPDGGSLYGVPGLFGAVEQAEDGKLASFSAAYDESWTIGLHAPFSEHVAYGGRDRYQRHDLAAAASHSIETWVQIEPEGSLAPLIATEIRREAIPYAEVTGAVRDDRGDIVESPAVVVRRDGREYAFVAGDNGEYRLRLPAGHYDAYATARNHGRSELRSFEVIAGQDIAIDFDGVRAPVVATFDIRERLTNDALDARISVLDGPREIVGYFGRNTFFTQMNQKGHLVQELAPGDYTFAVSSGGGFTSDVTTVEATLASGTQEQISVAIESLVDPTVGHWYNADLHHHSDVLDGFTEAEFVMRSQLAANVDVVFLSDHDSVINNAALGRLAASRGLPFVPGVELSPSWAHFNAFPVDDGKTVDIDTGQATVQEVFAEARRMGADLLELNHPHSDYGYFTADDEGAIPGGYDDSFDLVEIEANAGERNARTLERTWALWNAGQRAYLAGGSDVHDVWLSESGAARTYAYVPGDFSVEKFIAALKAGNSYATMGPLVFYPTVMFGSDVRHSAGEPLNIRFEVFSVHGPKTATLIERGTAISQQSAPYPPHSRGFTYEFDVQPESDSWYSLVIEDQAGRKAYTNPIWVTVEENDE